MPDRCHTLGKYWEDWKTMRCGKYIYIMKVSELSIIQFAFWIWNTIWRKISMIIQNFIEANSLLLQFNNQPNYPLILYLIYYFYRKHIMNFALAHDDRHKVSTIMSVTWTGHIWVIFFSQTVSVFRYEFVYFALASSIA